MFFSLYIFTIYKLSNFSWTAAFTNLLPCENLYVPSSDVLVQSKNENKATKLRSIKLFIY